MILKQDTIRYETDMKLGLIPMEGGTRSSLPASYFKANECGRCKLGSKHHSGAHYLSLTKPVGNASCHASLCTNIIITPKIPTSAFHWNIQSITHDLGIWINMGGLGPLPSSPMNAAPPLSKIK